MSHRGQSIVYSAERGGSPGAVVDRSDRDAGYGSCVIAANIM